MNAIAHALPPGYRIGQFDLAGHELASSPSPSRLLDLMLLADQLVNEKESHTAPPPGHWESLREDAGATLMQLMSGLELDEHSNWRDRDAVWEPKMFRLALRSIPEMTDGDLLTLFVQASENAYLHEAKPMQMRWQNVATRSREEILRRVADPEPSGGKAAPRLEEAEDQDDETDYVSLREVLRVAEDAFASELSDAKLLDLFVLAINCGGGPDDEIFDEILDPIKEMIEARLAQGSPESALISPVEGFDYPDHHAEALSAVLTGRLSNKNLLTIYHIAWDCDAYSPWVPVADLCRAQILRRMNPPPSPPKERSWPTWEDWKRAEMVRRVTSHDQGAVS